MQEINHNIHISTVSASHSSHVTSPQFALLYLYLYLTTMWF